MKKTRSLLILSATLLIQAFTSPITARTPVGGRLNSPTYPPRLYALEKTAQPQVSRELVPDAAEEFLIEIEPAAVAENPPMFIIDLPGLPPLKATRTRFLAYQPDWKSWFGTLRYAKSDSGGEAPGFIHIGYHGDQITALIEFEGERYRIVGGHEESHRLVQLDGELSPPPCALDDPVDMPQFGHEAPHGDGAPLEAAAAPSKSAFKVATRIDVLALYPRAFFTMSASVENGLFTFIQDSISLANNAFANSNVNAYYNLVGIVPVLGEYQPTNGIFASLDWLTNETMEVWGLRSTFGADIMAVFIPFEWNINDFCGVANLPRAGGGFIPGSGSFDQQAYSANRNGCGLNDFTLAHEIGHNYGMYHGDQPVDSLAIFPYGRGHVFAAGGQTKATLMGCYCPSGCVVGSAAICNRIPYFSDPAISYLGVPTGVLPAGSDPGRNNALVARNQVGNYAAFYPQSTNTPPTANFTVSCSGRTCSFNASSSTDNVPLPLDTYSYQWDFGDGTTSEGKVISHTYGSAGTFRVHLVVYDSGGQTDVVWKTATPQ
ncbi:MAG TPA: PKD domain-containing protein [Thermoanaerobaculia bacterium]|jgi:hypothetical protein|nr:PKD domain-containing protein [Thermoanaerobaculia bacterium]